MRVAAFAFFFTVWLLIAPSGCKTAQPIKTATLIARIYVEARAEEPAFPVTLPISGVRIQLEPRPKFLEFDIVRAETTRTELGTGLMLYFAPDASRDFYRLTVAAQGRRLVLTLNNRALAAAPINAPASDGAFLFFPEVSENEIPALALEINATAAALLSRSTQTR